MKHEGGSKLTNIDKDSGGWTKWGVTLDTWIKNGVDKDGDGYIDLEDLKLSTEEDAMKIAKKMYWDKIKGDDIHSQSIAEFLFDWAYNSGVGTAGRKVQKILGIATDGIIGTGTINAINNADASTLFTQLKAEREAFYRSIVHNNPGQEKFLKGWLNRNNSFKFTA